MPFPLALIGLIPNLLSYWQKKQEMKLRWFELVFSVIKDLLAFVWRFKRIILIVLMLGYCLVHYLSLRNQLAHAKAERLNAVLALNAHVAADAEAARVRDIENEAKNKLAFKIDKEKAFDYNKKISALNLNREKIIKDFLNEKKSIADLLDSSYRMRVETNSNIARLSSLPPATESSPSAGGNNAIDSIIEGCKLTTLDYNFLMQTWVEYCDVYGCVDVSR